MRTLFIVALLLLLGGCGGAAPAPTPTPGLAPAPTPTPGLAPDDAATAVAPEPVATVPTPDVPALSATATPEPQVEGVMVPEGYTLTTFAEGLQGPTQMLWGPDGRLWVAQLSGQESAGTGQVLALAQDGTSRDVLPDGLFKPTGIAVLGDALWIASGRDLLRAPLDESGLPGVPEVVLDELPFNGRSNGALTVTPDGTLLFETSGVRDGNAASEGSATLWELNPADPTNPRPIATGLKGAYAHTVDLEGRIWTTEIGDDSVNGGPPPDELSLVVEGADFGWPQCFGNQEAAENFGGTAEGCAATRPPVAIFGTQTTPTSVVFSPWEDGVMLVALWGPNKPMVVQVPFTVEGDIAAGRVQPLIEGMDNPQSLLLTNEGGLLASDFTIGTIYRVDRALGP